MLLYSIINKLKKLVAKIDLLSYFFYQATNLRINNPTAVLQGLVYLLVNQQLLLILHIQKKYNYIGKTLFKDINTQVALSKIFINILDNLALKSIYLIINSLNKCVVDLLKLLEFIIQKLCMSSCVKQIVSSCNQPNIKEELKQARYKVRLYLKLNTKSISLAISIYIKHKTF